MTDFDARELDELEAYSRAIRRGRLRFGLNLTPMQVKLASAKAYLAARGIPPWNRWKKP